MLVLLLASNAQSATKVVTGTIDRILTDGRLYGGCMVLAPTAQPLSAYGLNCRNNFFTFDCRDDAGQPGGRAQAELNLQQAQLAMALKTSVQLTVTDEVTINGNCYANRVVVFAPDN
jgi:hypothetical protein